MPTSTIVITGTRTSDPLTTRTYSISGAEGPVLSHVAGTYACAISPIDKSIVIAGLFLSIDTRKFAYSGNNTWSLQWSRTHGATVWAVAIDPNDNSIVTGGNLVDGFTTRKYAANGDLLWSRNHGASTVDVAIDPNNGSIVVVGITGGDPQAQARKYAANGDPLWIIDRGTFSLTSVAIDSSDGEVVVSGLGPDSMVDDNIQRYSSDGNFLSGFYMAQPSQSYSANSMVIDSRNKSIIFVTEPRGLEVYGSNNQRQWGVNPSNTQYGVSLYTGEDYAMPTPTAPQTVAVGGNRALVSWDWTA